MIVNYNAGEFKCKKQLLSMLDNNKIVYNNLNIDVFCKKLYSFITEDLFKEFFILDKDKYLANLGNLITCFDDSQINISYSKHNYFKKDIKIKDYRWIFVTSELSNEICIWKTKIASNANIIQASDAELCRYLINELNILTVHDSFAINLFNVHKLMDKTNDYFNFKLNTTNYSIFIII